MVSPLTLVACGAPLAARIPDLLVALMAAGWEPSVIGTPDSAAWLDAEAVSRLTGEPVRYDFRSPSQAKRTGEPTAVLVCPATFNTINKAAAGINDTYALGVLCEALGTGLPTVVVPMVNDKLSGHPAWPRSLDMLRTAGVTLLDIRSGRSGFEPVPSGTGGDAVAAFDPAWVVAALEPFASR